MSSYHRTPSSPVSSLSLGWWVVPICAFLLVAGGTLVPLTHAPDTVTFPIEVYAPNGSDAHVEEVTLHVEDPSPVDSLYVKAHQPFYHRGGNEQGQHEGFDVEGAASIQINDGPWVDVRNDTVNCAWPEQGYVQCIGGGFSTVRFTLPASDVQAGKNLIRFRFNGTDGIRSGYRVLGVGFMRASDPSVETFDPQKHGAHDSSLLQYDDFSAWGPPSGYDSPSDISAGQQWFESAQLIEHPNGEAIQASCNDCHARDGRDLKYFNYSNRTIAARSRFHGLTEEQGKQIAAYIRSIKLEKRDGSTYEAPGTPWDPPYQPGPELQATNEHPDASDQVYWAAGAGLEWVLNRDVKMLPYVFPDGNGGVDYRRDPHGNRLLNWRHVHMDSTLNMRAIPVSVQFPDWNNWLPDIHPKDAFPSQWSQSDARSTYQNGLRSALQNYSGGTNEKELGEIENKIQRLHSGSSHPKRASNESNYSENKFFIARLSTYQWVATKVWETMHMHHLEDVADDMYGDDPMKPFHEPRSWMGSQRTLFDVAPHISIPNGLSPAPHHYGSQRMDSQMSHIWYQLQATVNPGAKGNTQQPVDWNYQYSFLKSVPDAGVRMTASLVKAAQMLSNGYGVDGSGGNGFDQVGFVKGWEPFTIDPARFMRLNGTGSEYSNLPASLREDLFTATLRAWNDFTLRFPIDEFPRGTNESRYNPPDFVPKARGWTGPKDHAQKIYQGLIHTGTQFVEAYGAMDTLATWGAKMWPNTDGPAWDDIVDYEPPGEGIPPSLTFTSPSSGVPISGPDVTISADATDSDGTLGPVEFFLGGTSLGRVDSPPYEIDWTDVPPGSYQVSARVQDSQNLTARDTLSLRIAPTTSPSSTEQGVYYNYYEASFNSVSDFKHSLPAKSGTASGFTLSMNPRSDHFAVHFYGYIEIPEDGAYTFYTASDDGSKLWINGQQIVNNDGIHATQERSGTIILPAGRHSIEVGYFEKKWGSELKVQWSGPSFDKRPIEDTHLYLAGPTASIEIEQGWNLLSTHLAPYETDLETMLEPVVSDLAIVKNEEGDTYLPELGIDEIETWNGLEGYKVYAKTDQTLPVRGRLLDPEDTPIELHSGWNLVAYLPRTQMEPRQAFQSISDELVLVKDQDGNTYVPSFNINEVGQLEPGESYKVYVDGATELTYPSSTSP